MQFSASYGLYGQRDSALWRSAEVALALDTVADLLTGQRSLLWMIRWQI